MRSRWMTGAALSLLLSPASTLLPAQSPTSAAQPAKGTEKTTPKPGGSETPGAKSEKPKTGGSGGTPGVAEAGLEKPKTGGSGGTPGVAAAGLERKFTGCVRTGAAPLTFELSNLKRRMESTATAATGGDTVGASAGSAALKLVASGGVDLNAHVGHQVEVSGTFITDSSSAETSAAPADASSPKTRTFKVTTVKMVSSTCSSGTD